MNLKKDTAQLVIANFIQLLFGLFQVIFFSRLVAEKQEFGQLQQVLLVSSLLIASAGALPNSINYFFGLYELNRADAGQLIKRFFFASLLLAALISSAVLCFHQSLATAFSNDLFRADLSLVAILIFLRLFNLMYQNVCLIKGQLSHLMIIHTLQLFTLFSVFTFRDVSGHLSLIFLIKTLVAAEIIKTIPFLISVLPSVLSGKFNYPSLKLTPQEWRYVSYLLLNGILIAFTSQADRLIVSSFSDPATYSDYSLGTFANPLIGVVLASLSTTFVPVLSTLFAKKDYAGILQLWKRTSQTGAVLVLPLVFFTILFGNDVVLLLFSSKYQSAALLFQVFNCKYLLVFVVFSITMNAIGLEKFTLINSIINLATSSLLVIAGLKLYGATGAVAGSIISIYLGYVFPVILINRKLHCRFTDYFPLRTFFLTGILCLSIGIVLFLAKKMFALSPYITIFMFAPLYYMCCLLLLNRYVLQVIDIRKLKNRFFS